MDKEQDINIEKIMRDQVDNDNYVRWSTKYNTYVDLGKWITSKLDEPGYNKIQIGSDVMKYILEQMESAKDIRDNTEMGKKMKELENVK